MSATRWTLRDAGPLVIERGVAAVLRLLLYRNQIAVVASSATLTLIDANGGTVLARATGADGTETTAGLMAADTTSAMAYSTRWRARWAGTAAGEAFAVEQDVWLVIKTYSCRIAS